jgi:hypothetical protein
MKNPAKLLDEAVGRLKAEGIGVFRYNRESAMILLGSPTGEEKYYHGMFVEPNWEDGFLLYMDTEFSYSTSDETLAREVFDRVFDDLIDDSVEVGALEYDAEHEVWTCTLVRSCPNLEDLIRRIGAAFEHELWFDVTDQKAG